MQSVGTSFSCGIISGIFASVVTHPADVVKTSLQLFPSHYRHDALRLIFKKQGFSGFFVGLLPRLFRRTLIATLSWTVYDQVNPFVIFTVYSKPYAESSKILWTFWKLITLQQFARIFKLLLCALRFFWSSLQSQKLLLRFLEISKSYEAMLMKRNLFLELWSFLMFFFGVL